MEAVGNLGLLLTTGEHEYSRFGYKQLIDSKAAHILQPDITWLGGITEARRMMALAAANDVLVVPHGSSVYSTISSLPSTMPRSGSSSTSPRRVTRSSPTSAACS